MDARSTDTKLFHKLINKQIGNSEGYVSELTANGQVYRTEEGILKGWRGHFEALATPNDNEDFDMKYARLVSDEVPVISDLCKTSESEEITPEQIRKAIESLNTGKAADYYGVTAEHFLHGGEAVIQVMTHIINSLYKFGRVTDAMKIGTLTPVYKKKGLSTDAKNYAGITVLSVVTKILEAVIRDQIQPIIEQQQNRLQRRFTKHSFP